VAGEGRPSITGVLSGLSHALDITEGHPRGHSVRAAVIGLELGGLIGTPVNQRLDLLYALLLKDAGCSANASRLYELFGGVDQDVKRAAWTRDWRRATQNALYAIRWAGRGASWDVRLRKLLQLGRLGSDVGRELFQLRCDRGAEVARLLGLGDEVADAIHTMDEHWDGGGYPNGLAGDQIPMGGQIIGVAQVMEIFWGLGGGDAAVRVVEERAGSWFDPTLARAAISLGRDAALWARVGAVESGAVDELLPYSSGEDHRVMAEDDDLDRVADAFALIVDGKSPFTADHSRRVADYAVGIAHELGFDLRELRAIRRVALVHDLGKLAVPNSVLEKPTALDDREWAVIRTHPSVTFDILRGTPGFAAEAASAAAHHERLDGSGYHLGLGADQLTGTARVLAVADTLDAMVAARPYRGPLSPEMALYILRRDAGSKYCEQCVDACSLELIEAVADPRSAPGEASVDAFGSASVRSA
jgi:HD-GYP domain-containing protein (c-di-GMP phosphodiesterase class II)